MMVAIYVLAAIGLCAVAVAAWEGGKKLVGWGEGEVHHLTGWVKTEVGEAKKWVDGRMDNTINRVQLFVGGMDTRLESMDTRLKSWEIRVNSLECRLSAVETAIKGTPVPETKEQAATDGK